jgi:hypothetical protein
VITKNATNYVAASRLFMVRNWTLYWIPCVSHCIDLMLEDMGKISWIKEIVDSTRSVIIYIYKESYICSYTHEIVHREQGVVLFCYHVFCN